jgi:hypothetical protein
MTAAWVLIPAAKTLQAEFTKVFPDRDHASDGAIGDLAHQQEVSDHNPDETGAVPIHDADSTNEVHAIDVDNNLNDSDVSMEEAVQFILGRCRSGAERRLRYVIYNRRIWSASSSWVQKAYTGASAHTEHAHFSFSYDSSLEASTASYHLEELVALSDADLNKITNAIKANATNNSEVKAQVIAAIQEQLDSIAKAVLVDYRMEGTQTPGSDYKRNAMQLMSDQWFAAFLGKMGGGNALPPEVGLGKLLGQVDALKTELNALTTQVSKLTGELPQTP